MSRNAGGVIDCNVALSQNETICRFEMVILSYDDWFSLLLKKVQENLQNFGILTKVFESH